MATKPVWGPQPEEVANDKLNAMVEYSEALAGAGVLFRPADPQPAGLWYRHEAGRVRAAGGAIIEVAAGQIALTANAANYIEINAAGAVSKATSGFSSDKKPLALVVTDAGVRLSIADKRIDFDFSGGSGGSSFNAQGAWDAGTTYAASDWVSYNGSSWVALQPSTGVVPVEGENWTLMAQGGANGASGTTLRFSEDAPDNSIGVDGDWMQVTSTGSFYERVAGAYVFRINLTGPPGPAGGTVNWIDEGWALAANFATNDALAHGAPASSYRAKVGHTATAESEPGIGADWEDFWMVTAAAGAPGPAGASGTIWHSGTGNPGSGIGNNGEFYFNTSNADIWKKLSGTWTHQINLKGLKGDKGDTGDKGDDGDPGAAGAAATIVVGTVTTVAPGEPATVANVGTSNAAVLNFEIPSGEPGEGGGEGSGATIEAEFVYGETIAANQPVYIELNDAVGTAGRVYKMNAASAASSTSAWFIGFAIDAGNAGDTGTVRLVGELAGLSSLTAGAVYYAASGGGITDTTPPYARIVGIAKTSTTLVINSRGANDSVLPTQVAIAGVYGYAASGITGTPSTDRIVFASDTTAGKSNATISSGRVSMVGLSNPDVAGYATGGYNGSGIATTDKLAFSIEVSAVQSSANLSVGRWQPGAVSERTTKGYITEGGSSAADKLTFATDTTAAQSSALLDMNRLQPSGVYGGETKGYFGGGYDEWSANTNKITFATDTTSLQTSANITVIREFLAGMSEGRTKGFWLGGQGGSTTATDKVAFATDTTSAQSSAELVNGHTRAQGIGQGETKGYVVGSTTSTDMLTYATDTTVAQSSANLTATRQGPANMSDVGL